MFEESIGIGLQFGKRRGRQQRDIFSDRER